MKAQATDALEREIAQEKAQALALTARALEGALRALREHDALHDAAARDDKRTRLVALAAERVLHYLVQREAHGLRDARYVFDYYAIPTEVVARLGVRA